MQIQCSDKLFSIRTRNPDFSSSAAAKHRQYGEGEITGNDT